MKIAIFTDSFLPGVGGTEKAVLGLANELQKNNEVIVFCPKYNKKYKDNFSFKVSRAKSIKLTNNDYFAMPSLTSSLKKTLNEFKPDIIHCQSVSPMTAFAIKYAKKNNTPIIMTVHTKFKTAFQRSIKSKLIVDLLIKNLVKKLNRANMVYTVSNDMINELNTYGFNKQIKVIRNGAMFERIENIDELKKAGKEHLKIENEKNVLLYVGHIVKFKNLQFVFDALEIVKKSIPDFKFVLIGYGFDFEYFNKYVKKLNLENNVIFTGQITDQKLLSQLYSVGELFLFPSIFDNDPLTIVESALHKIPALTLKNTGSSERIEDNVSGFVVNNDVNEFANKIIELLNNKEKLQEAGILAERLIPKTWNETANEYLEEYKKLVNK